MRLSKNPKNKDSNEELQITDILKLDFQCCAMYYINHKYIIAYANPDDHWHWYYGEALEDDINKLPKGTHVNYIGNGIILKEGFSEIDLVKSILNIEELDWI